MNSKTGRCRKKAVKHKTGTDKHTKRKSVRNRTVGQMCKYADYKNMKEKDFIVQMYHAIEKVKVYSKNDIEILWKFDDMLKYLLDENRKKVI